MGYELLSFRDATELSRAVAVRWAGMLATMASLGQVARCRAALSGGRVAKVFLAESAQEFHRQNLDLSGLQVFWGDERCVGPEDPESNYRLAQDSFLNSLNLPASQVHRIPGEQAPEMAAVEAEKAMRSAIDLLSEGWPVLDLVFLGMGEDGHVASLFPGAPMDVVDSSAVYVPVIGPKPPPNRISLTYGMLKVAREVWVLASGAGKEQALRDALGSQTTSPLGKVLKSRSHTVIFTDIPGV
jgi:6-phosphogluconolactonase